MPPGVDPNTIRSLLGDTSKSFPAPRTGELGIPGYPNATLTGEQARNVYTYGEQQMKSLNQRLIDQGMSPEMRAKTMSATRNALRTWTRDLMVDRGEAAKLDRLYPNQSWEEVLDKYKGQGLKGDELWNMSDDDLVAMAGQEIEKLHLAEASKVRFGFVERVHKAYPIYDELYGERVRTIRDWLQTIANLTQVGRNGLHRYNNSDHSMLTAMRAVDNILEGTHHDIWAVNAESVYHEEHQENEDPYKRPPTTPAMEQPLASER